MFSTEAELGLPWKQTAWDSEQIDRERLSNGHEVALQRAIDDFGGPPGAFKRGCDDRRQGSSQRNRRR
jgi:hypothetical protein